MKFILFSLIIGNILFGANSNPTPAAIDVNCNCSQKPSDNYPICGNLDGVPMSFRGSLDLQCHAECRDTDIAILYNGPCAEANYKLPKNDKVKNCGCEEKSSDDNPVCGWFEGRIKEFRGFHDVQCYASCRNVHIEILHAEVCKEIKYNNHDNNLKTIDKSHKEENSVLYDVI